MPYPWVIDATGEPVRQVVELPVMPSGDWASVESYLGLSLPTDFKELVGSGPSLEFDDELVIYSPFDRYRYVSLLFHIERTAWAGAVMRASSSDRHQGPVYPEAGGILSWGADSRGALYYWNTSDADPDAWTIVVSGRPIQGIQHHSVGLSGYLTGVANGTIDAAALSYWPQPDPQLRRLQSDPQD